MPNKSAKEEIPDAIDKGLTCKMLQNDKIALMMGSSQLARMCQKSPGKRSCKLPNDSHSTARTREDVPTKKDPESFKTNSSLVQTAEPQRQL